MTLYEINQQGYAQLPKMTTAELEQAEYTLAQCLERYKEKGNTYLAFTNFDNQHSFTMFVYKTFTACQNMAHEIIDVAKSFGTLKGIELSNQEMIEFWIDTKSGCYMFALYPYDSGVIEV